MSDRDESHSAIQSLFHDLELGDHGGARAHRHLRAEFDSLLKLPRVALLKVGLDVSVVAGLSGDWDLALDLVQKLVNQNDDRLALKIWQLRILVELERFAEALALGSAIRWNHEDMLHVNYLTGLCFEALGMNAEARLRFDAVFKTDATYRNVAQKLSNH